MSPRSGTPTARWLCVFGLAGCLFSPALAESPTETQDAVLKKRQAVVDAEDPVTASRAFTALFHLASDEQLQTLKSDPHVGISLVAAKNLLHSDDPQRKAAAHPERFIGFLEGRTGLTCPPYWSAKFVTDFASVDRDDLLQAALQQYGPLGVVTESDDSEVGGVAGEKTILLESYGLNCHQITVGKHTLYAPKTIEVRDRVLVIDQREILLHDNALRALHEARKSCSAFLISAIVSGDKAIVALSGAGNWSFPVLCLQAQSGELLWKSKVWALTPKPYSIFGDSSHFIELTTNGTTLGVFGSTWQVQYAEAFDLETGKPILRYSPRFWNSQGETNAN